MGQKMQLLNLVPVRVKVLLRLLRCLGCSGGRSRRILVMIHILSSARVVRLQLHLVLPLLKLLLHKLQTLLDMMNLGVLKLGLMMLGLRLMRLRMRLRRSGRSLNGRKALLWVGRLVRERRGLLVDHDDAAGVTSL